MDKVILWICRLEGYRDILIILGQSILITTSNTWAMGSRRRMLMKARQWKPMETYVLWMQTMPCAIPGISNWRRVSEGRLCVKPERPWRAPANQIRQYWPRWTIWRQFRSWKHGMGHKLFFSQHLCPEISCTTICSTLSRPTAFTSLSTLLTQPNLRWIYEENQCLHLRDTETRGQGNGAIHLSMASTFRQAPVEWLHTTMTNIHTRTCHLYRFYRKG